MAIIGSMVAIVLHERSRVQKIENESIAIFQTQHNINTTHRYVTTLVTYGESVMVWNDEDSGAYRERRVRTDSMLQTLRTQCKDFIQPEQIDSLRTLLAAKEDHLFQIMEATREQKKTDSLLFHQKPTVTTQTTTRTVTRKKKGIAGFFGGKETVQMPVVTTRQTAPDKELISLLNKRKRDIETYTDSLRLCNRELNRKLRLLITSLDEQTWNAFRSKEERLKASYEHSTLVITGLIIFSIILLFISYLVIQRDIKVKAKNRKHLEETIEQNIALLEMRKNIILTISHDIRAPLNVISGSAELAVDTREKKRRNTHLNNIRIVCRHVVHLLNNLLDVYRLNEAKETRNDVPFNLNALLERIAFGFSHVINNKGILFNHDFTGTDVKLCGDVDRIEQILDNLLSNAVKFTETGTISLNARYNKGELVLEIKDTGIGMSEDALLRIFRPFERLGSVRNAEGFGLGLPITKGLVNLLGGTIRLDSKKGKGSRFTVEISMQEAEEQLGYTSNTPVYHNNKFHDVVAIDNDEVLLLMLKEMYSQEGIHCDTCTDAAALMEMIRQKEYSLLLTDLNMPDINGFELLELLRSSNVGNSPTIPVVVATASGSCNKGELLAKGFAGCLFKPFSISELMEVSDRCAIKATPDGKPDFSALLSYGNEAVMLEKLITETEKEMQAVRDAAKEKDLQKLDSLIHHLRSSWEVLRADQPLNVLYGLLRGDALPDGEALSHAVTAVLDKGVEIIRLAEEERRKYEDE